MNIKYCINGIILTTFLMNIEIASAQEVTSPSGETFSQSSAMQSGFLGGDDSSISLDAPEGATMENDADVTYNGASPRDMVGDTKHRSVKFTPFVGADVTYSDNINLSNKNKESGFLYGVHGGVRADAVTERIDAAGTAAANVYYNPQNSNGADISPSIEGAATAELIRNKLFVDGLASYASVYNSTSAFSPSGANNGNLDGYGSIGVSPYWRQKIGNWAVGELRYGYDQGFGTADNIGDAHSHSYQATLGTGDRFNRYSLKGRLAHIDSSYEEPITGQSGDMQQSTADLTGTYGLTRTLSLLGALGYDQVESANINDDKFSGVYYSGGLEYRPNQRTRLMGMVGERYNALNYTLEGSYQVTKYVYAGATAITSLMPPSGQTNRSLQLAGQQTADFGKFLADNRDMSVADAIRTKYNIDGGEISNTTNDGSVITGNGQNLDPYRDNYAGAYLGANKGAWTASASLGYDERDFTRSADENAIIATAGLGYQINQKWSTSLDGFYYGLQTDYKPNESDTYGGSVGLNYAITKNVNAYGVLRRTQRDAPIKQYEYVEHAVTAGISASF